MIRILICDDNECDLRRIGNIVEETFEDIKYSVHLYKDVEDISEYLLKSCDVALLDIDFGNAKENGLTIAKKLRNYRKDAVVVFITNYIEYAVSGYEVRAFRYLLKEDLNSKLGAFLRLALKEISIKKEKIKIQINGEIIDVTIENILYIESQKHIIIMHTMTGRNKKQYQYYASLSSVERELESHGFLRIHRSFLVNMRHIKKFNCHEATLSDGTKLKVSERSYADQKSRYLQWRGNSEWNL